ncbi:hypothetical protein [Synechococcus sp. BIOS-E4-1]|uniref:hypothetical protein n=1 Tax=Synechococcus sp. BIOS-E4-1 TaxID=1400864 RepID=UPI001647E088|nr:hypothetical protein [Synechococcus sp. BIOS-E4-1]
MKVIALFLLALAVSLPAHADPDKQARKKALRALCPIALKAGGGWRDDNLNAAIATIDSGQNWLDPGQIWSKNALATAYKLCNYGGYMR